MMYPAMEKTGLMRTLVLQTISRLGTTYGYELTCQIRQCYRGVKDLTEGALYPLLHVMEQEGILDIHIKYVGNRIRRYYTLNEYGYRELAHCKTT